MTLRERVGLLPAAGIASRLRPFRYPKELLPVAYRKSSDGLYRPIVAAEYALEAMALSGVVRCVAIIADWKVELVRIIGDGFHLGLDVAYVDQQEALGLARAIDRGYRWIAEATAVLALPDTIFEPNDSVLHIVETLEGSGADLVLGVFPTADPGSLAPVTFDMNGRVSMVQEKPTHPLASNTWGIATWSPAFTKILHDKIAEGSTEGLSITTYFQDAVDIGLDVRAVFFPDGRYTDLGVASGLTQHILGGGT